MKNIKSFKHIHLSVQKRQMYCRIGGDTMKKKRYTASLLAVLLAAGLVTGCGAASSSTADSTTGAAQVSTSASAAADSGSSDGKVITIGFSTAWDSMMPYNSASGSMYNALMLDKIYDRLAFAEIGGSSFKPRAAKSWEAADDNQSIVFHLDENATWSDGQKVTADDWVYTFQLITDPAFTGTSRGDAKSLAGTDDNGVRTGDSFEGVEKLDDYTIKFHLKNPSTPEDWLISHNRQVYVLPQHVLKDIPVDSILTSDVWNNPVGSGPMKFVSQVAGSEMVLAPRPEYQLGNTNASQVILKVVDSTNALNSLISGELDYNEISNQVSETNKAVATGAGLTVTTSDTPNFFFEMIINNSNVSDANLRKALWYALDVDALIKTYNGGNGTSTDTYVLPDSPYYNSDVNVSYDPDKAKELMQEAGYDGKTLTLACGSSRESLASLMKQYWDAVGLNVQIQIVDVATMFSGLKDGTYDLGLSGHTPTYGVTWFDDATSLHVLKGEGNSSYSVTDPKLGEYYNEINSTFDTEKRAKLVKEYQQYLADTAPYVPLWFSDLNYIESNVQNIDYLASMMCNDNIYEWQK